MARITREVKLFIVTELACYGETQDIIAAVQERFGIEVSPSTISYYNPTLPSSVKLGAEYRALFQATRKQFDDEVAAEPIAKKRWRLRQLERSARTLWKKADDQKSPAMAVQLHKTAAELLEQAAKEVGEVYTNRRELTGKDGKDLIPEANLDDLTDEELLAMAQRIVAEREGAE